MGRVPTEDALCDLNAAYSIIAICEGGIFRTSKGSRFADKLVGLCKAHAQTQLQDYDRHHARSALRGGGA